MSRFLIQISKKDVTSFSETELKIYIWKRKKWAPENVAGPTMTHPVASNLPRLSHKRTQKSQAQSILPIPCCWQKPACPQMERIVKFALVPTPSRWVLFPKAFLVHCPSQVLFPKSSPSQPLGFLCKVCFLIWLICFMADCKLDQCHGTLCPSRGMTRAQLSQAGKEHPSLNSPWHFKKVILDAQGREKILTEGHTLSSTYSHQCFHMDLQAWTDLFLLFKINF